MDCLLINPPREIPQRADFPPMGLAYIASCLKQSGIEACVLDASALSWEMLRKMVSEKAPYIVGISCWTVERGQSFKTARIVKETVPDVKIIIGGHHATAFPEHMFKLACADVVVIGEGERTAVDLVRALLNNENLRKIKGIAHQEDGKVIITQSRDFIEDLDTIPLPSYDDFNFDKYLGLSETKGRTAAIITSRGCSNKCVYCSASKFWKRKWRARSAKSVLDEIQWLYGDYSVKNFFFFDDNFTVRKERVMEICQGIMERKLDIKWVAESHVTHIDKEVLICMKKSGCYRIDYGVESGSPKILENIKKNQTVEQIEEAFRLTYEVGINPRALLMVGNPGEDEITIDETIKLMRKINPYDSGGCQVLWILPETEIYEMAKSKGLISDEYWERNDSMVYYTGDYSVEELKLLRDKMIRGLAKNKGWVKGYREYLVRMAYYKYPILQRMRKWRGIVGR